VLGLGTVYGLALGAAAGTPIQWIDNKAITIHFTISTLCQKITRKYARVLCIIIHKDTQYVPIFIFFCIEFIDNLDNVM
jgi:hypothetical protein